MTATRGRRHWPGGSLPPARAAGGPLAFGPANRARARADARDGEGDRQYPVAPAWASALSESVPDGRRAVSAPTHRAAPGVSRAPPQSVPRCSLAASAPSSAQHRALVARRSRQYPMAGPGHPRPCYDRSRPDPSESRPGSARAGLTPAGPRAYDLRRIRGGRTLLGQVNTRHWLATAGPLPSWARPGIRVEAAWHPGGRLTKRDRRAV